VTALTSPRAVRALAAVFAFTWLVLPGFGLIDLSVTWDDDWPVVLEAGWGLFFTVVVGVPFVVVALRPRRAAAPVAQLAVGAGALAVASLLSVEPGAAVLAAVVAVEAALVARPRGGERLRPGRPAIDRPLLLLGLASVVPWLAYAADMAALNRQSLADADITNGVDHYSVQAATALAVAVLVLVAAAWPRARALSGLSAGTVAAYLGIVSYAAPGADGGFDRTWSALAVVWGAATSAAALVAARRAARPASAST
jgi:hypothetical protein